MIAGLPAASAAEIEKVATQIANALRANFRSHENFTPMTKTPQVNTNVGTWICYGLLQPVEVGRLGETVITEARPHSKTLMACSQVPTSQQKTVLIEAITLRVAALLGVPKDAIVRRDDPGRNTAATPAALGQVEHQLSESLLSGAAVTDPYKAITRPYTISMSWPWTTT